MASPGSSANSLSFEIEFGPGEGWLGLHRQTAQGLSALPSSKTTWQGLVAEA